MELCELRVRKRVELRVKKSIGVIHKVIKMRRRDADVLFKIKLVAVFFYTFPDASFQLFEQTFGKKISRHSHQQKKLFENIARLNLLNEDVTATQFLILRQLLGCQNSLFKVN